MEWNEEWEIFCSKWKLDEEIKKIEHWLDWRFYSLDFSLYVRSPNEKKEFHGSSNNGDSILNLITRYEIQCQEFFEFDEAIQALNLNEQDSFNQIFIDRNEKYSEEHLFLKEALIVKIASKDEDYIFNDVIEIYFSVLKNKFLVFIENEEKKRKERINELKMKYSFLIKPNSNWDVECGHGNHHYQQHLFLLGILKYEGILNREDFRRISFSVKSGKSYVKFFEKQNL